MICVVCLVSKVGAMQLRHADTRKTLLLILVLCSWAELYAANSIVIESKSVAPGATGVQVGVYFSNDIPITDFEFPVEVHELTAGAYITNSWGYQINASGRLNNSPLGQAGANWPAANVFTGVYASIVLPHCSGPVSQTFHAAEPSADFISPDAILYTASSTGDAGLGEDIDLDPGADPPGVPSFIISFDVTSVVGTFELDTCCIHPTYHVMFIDAATQLPVLPSVTSGVITIGNPGCPPTVDVCGRIDTCGGLSGKRVPDCIMNVQDVTCMVDYIFRGGMAPCPKSRADYNCDCIPNVVDVTTSVNVVFRGQTPPDPCPTPCP